MLSCYLPRIRPKLSTFYPIFYFHNSTYAFLYNLCVLCNTFLSTLLFYCYKSSCFPSIPNFNVEILLPSIFFWTLYCGSVNKFYFKLMIHLVEFQKIHCSAILSCTNSTNILEKIILQTFKLKVLFRTIHIVKQ